MSAPFIIAEISASHNGSLKNALDLIDAAADAGANGVKFQTWNEIALPGHIIESGPWAGRDLAELYAEARTPWDWHEAMFSRARLKGLVPLSTPFDPESVDFLETLSCPIYKVASAEIIDLPLIRHIASKRLPMIVSTGMATEEEIGDALETIADQGLALSDVTLLKCVSAYPAKAEDFNLVTMHDLGNFGCDFGLSDHTTGSAVAVAATALGATVIEKHIGLDRSGPDGGFAMLPSEFALMVSDCRTAAKALGRVQYGPLPQEADTLRLRRSLWVVKDVSAGDVVSRDNVRSLRPAGGMAPGALEGLIGIRFSQKVSRGTSFTEGLLDNA